MSNLVTQDLRQIFVCAHAVEEGMQCLGRNSDDLLITPMFVRHQQHTDRPAADDRARHDRNLRDDQNVDRIAVFRKGVRDESVVAR
jgi:hypothetical protein